MKGFSLLLGGDNSNFLKLLIQALKLTQGGLGKKKNNFVWYIWFFNQDAGIIIVFLKISLLLISSAQLCDEAHGLFGCLPLACKNNVFRI